VVIPVEDVAAIDLEGLGASLEVHPAFPARTNVHFVQALDPAHLVMRVWERGAGPTLACGTGACATLVACHLLGLSDRRARLDLPGGSLVIDWDAANGHVFMTGPAEAVFQGVLATDLIALPDDSDVCEAPADLVESAASEPGEEPIARRSATTNAAPPIECSTACVNGCMRPEACASAEARARVAALLGDRSLDELVDLATNSFESRTRARFAAGGFPADPGV
jgi:diaminopimelate epimerase